MQNKECNSDYTKQVVIILIMTEEVSLTIEEIFSLWRFLLKKTVTSYLISKKGNVFLVANPRTGF